MKSKNLAMKNTIANEKKADFSTTLKMTLFEKTVAVEKIKR